MEWAVPRLCLKSNCHCFISGFCFIFYYETLASWNKMNLALQDKAFFLPLYVLNFWTHCYSWDHHDLFLSEWLLVHCAYRHVIAFLSSQRQRWVPLGCHCSAILSQAISMPNPISMPLFQCKKGIRTRLGCKFAYWTRLRQLIISVLAPEKLFLDSYFKADKLETNVSRALKIT